MRIDVVDHGPGISEADREAIFDEFRQLHGGPDRQAEGTGLGLALVRRILQMLGGAVTVASRVGEGSTFSVHLPLEPPEPSRPVYSTLAVSEWGAGGEPPPAAHRPRVLIIEDDPNAGRLLANALEAAGYATSHVSRGEDALQHIAEEPPDVVTLDVILPGVDGWEVLKRLKERSSTRGIPVVIVSVTDDRELAVALGADDFFVKPVPRDTLVSRVRQLARSGSARGTATVLLIDDDHSVHEILADQVAELEIRLLHALDGNQGVELARAEQPSVIVLDLMMPGTSGFEVASLLKQDPATAGIPIVVLTAMDLTQEQRRRLQGLIQGLQPKAPPWPVQLTSTIRDLLDRNP